MRYLKTKSVFEHSLNTYDESEQWLKDIFLELEDDDYNVSITNSKDRFHSSAAMCRTYDVTIHREKSFKLSDIFETILTSESYMNADGWIINHVRFRTTINKWFSLNRSDIQILKNLDILIKEIHDINYIEISFKMDPTSTVVKESIDPEVKSNLNDILLELEDIGLRIHIEDSIHNKISIIIESLNGFNLDENIYSSLYHLDSYLKEVGYKLRFIQINAKDKDSIRQRQLDSADDLDDLKRLTGVFGYNDFSYINLKYIITWK